MKNYRVVILTAGEGRRLSPETNYYNKALITIGNKPALSYIIELFDEDVEIVLANNYKHETVEDFVEIAYPERDFIFVNVDNIGSGYGPGYALLQCEKELQCPFYFFTCDTLIDKEDLEDLEYNWVGVSTIKGSSAFYSKVRIEKDATLKFGKLYDKAIKYSWSAEHDENTYAFIGCAGIRDYKQYFDNLRKSDIIRGEKQILSGFKNLETLAIYCTSWLDVGTRDSLEYARKINNDVNPFRKIDEFTVDVNSKIIKFNSSRKWVSDRLLRSRILNKLVPECDSKGNFLFYDKIEGKLLTDLISHELNTALFIKFLYWCSDNLWKDIVVSEDDIKEIAAEFYYFKTLERLKQLYSNSNINDSIDIINGTETREMEFLLSNVKHELIYMLPKIFHGDLHTGNVIVSNEKKFYLIDWRQGMDSRIDIGDIYYDLVKMLHAFVLPHESLYKGKFVIDKTEKGHIWFSYEENELFYHYVEHMKDFVKNNNLDWKRVELLTSLVYINMSPLHPSPYRELLYYLGKLKLHKWWEKYASNN